MKISTERTKELSFVPKNWYQSDDGSWLLLTGVSDLAVEEMRRIIGEGGVVITFDAKG
jgi:hypothetical protein